jgi:hypothetical protein
MDDLVLLHRGDLQSARLARDHADALRRTNEGLRPIAIALRVAGGRAYDPSGVIPELRTAIEEWITCQEDVARDFDDRAIAYEANAARRVAGSTSMTVGEMARQLAHNVLVCAGAVALVIIAYHSVEKWRGHIGGNVQTVTVLSGGVDGHR